ncbi:hypothetical protein FHR38_003220 [Micromonospora polyrhachis]|uniref:Uncharacterized protein n=1 Tax=Micromonospora polyrhachis TaxID=1282883 RepID=A0A7W7SSF6_9ACTN|nr:hypothetical protein [Micromonospora polyrhachis]
MRQPGGRVVRLGVARPVRPHGAKRGGQMTMLSRGAERITPLSEAMA